MSRLKQAFWGRLSLFFLLGAIPCCLQASTVSFSYDTQNKEEGFFLRRIVEFWKDRDYDLVKTQITSFLETHKESKITPILYGILGDLHLQEKEYKESLEAYGRVHSKDVHNKIAINRLQALYELNQYTDMVNIGTPYLSNTPEEIRVRMDEFHFLMAEAYFRQALGFESADEKMRFLAQAEPLYEQIIDSSFHDPALFALAEIYYLQQNFQKAASSFVELSEKYKSQKEDLLFKAALSQAKFDTYLAMDTFSAVKSLKGNKKHDAACNHLILLFQENRYADVVANYKDVLSQVDAETALSLNYVVAKSFFSLKQYDQALVWLEKIVDQSKEATGELHNSLVMLLTCAQELSLEEIFQKALTKFSESFPQDQEISQAQFIYALMLKNQKNYELAESELAKLMVKADQFPNKENLLLEYGSITHKRKKWEQSYSTFSAFKREFPESTQIKSAEKYLLSNALELLKEIDQGQTVSFSKKHLLQDLDRVLEQEDLLTDAEKKECQFLQGKLHYDLAYYKSAIALLENFLVLYPEDALVGDSHLLLALCHHKEGHDATLFCKHAEHALENNPDLQNKSSIHLELYNSYLTLAENKKSDTAFSEEMFQRASENLYQAMQMQDIAIKQENKLWLASFYFDKVGDYPKIYETDQDLNLADTENDSYFERSSVLFADLLLEGDEQSLVQISKDKLSLEWEVMKLAHLLGRSHKSDKKVTLLKSLIEQQNKNHSWDWKLSKEALLELAKTYELLDHKGLARETFAFMQKQYRKNPTFLSEYAHMHALRLQFSQIPKEHYENSSHIVQILTELKEYQIRKSVSSEPLHLEASLEYAFIRAHLQDSANKAPMYAFYLNRIKEDYTNKEDPLVESYHALLEKDAEKNMLFEQYQAFIDLELERCDYISLLQEGRKDEASSLKKELQKKYSAFAEQNTLYYLQLRVQKSLKALEQKTLT